MTWMNKLLAWAAAIALAALAVGFAVFIAWIWLNFFIALQRLF